METECILTLQSQGHVASNMHSGLVHFNGPDIVVLGHLWADIKCFDTVLNLHMLIVNFF